MSDTAATLFEIYVGVYPSVLLLALMLIYAPRDLRPGAKARKTLARVAILSPVWPVLLVIALWFLIRNLLIMAEWKSPNESVDTDD